MKGGKADMSSANSRGKGAMLVVTSFAVVNIAAVLGIVLFVAVRLSVCKISKKASANLKSPRYHSLNYRTARSALVTLYNHW